MIKFIKQIMKPFTEKHKMQFPLRLMFLPTLIVFLAFEYDLFKNRGPKDLTIAILISMAVILGGFFIATHVFCQLKKTPASTVFYSGATITMLTLLLTSYRSEIGNYIAIGATTVFLFCLALELYKLIYRFKEHTGLINSLWLKLGHYLLLLISGVLVFYIFFTKGFAAPVFDNAFESFHTDIIYHEADKQYDIVKGVYGNEKYLDKYTGTFQLESQTTSIGYFLGSWEKSREAYLGHNIYNVPLNGQVYMPKGEGPFPIVLMVHGNHEMVMDSEIGYDYLGNYLAERGFVMISVDENFLNYSTFDSEIMDDHLGNENDARAYVLLSHLKYLQGENKDENSYFYQKLDMENIALMGHSRGGEAVAVAAYFNTIKTLPNDYRKQLGMHYGIKSIVAIAPTDKQYKPAGRNIRLDNINYLLLHGSHDMDVSYMAGNNQYERIALDDGKYFKSTAWIYGANHGQFNETWYVGDTNPIAGKLHNTGQLMPREKQEAIASQLIYYFLETTLGDQDYRAGFKNYSAFVDLPKTLLMTQYHDGYDEVIADFSEDPILETATMPGVYISSAGLSKWYEGRSRMKGRTTDIFGAYIEWQGNYEGGFSFDVTQSSIELNRSDSIYLTLSDLTKDADENYAVKVVLEDQEGHQAELSTGYMGLLQHDLIIDLTKFERFEDHNQSETKFQSFELPLVAFEGVDQLDFQQLKAISLVLPEGKEHLMMVKDIGIRHQD